MERKENNKISNRITVALDDKTNEVLSKLKENSPTSTSEIIRKAQK